MSTGRLIIGWNYLSNQSKKNQMIQSTHYSLRQDLNQSYTSGNVEFHLIKTNANVKVSKVTDAMTNCQKPNVDGK